MKQLLVIVAALLIFSLALQCDEKKPNDIDFEDPGRFFPINFEYTWTYAYLGGGCVASEGGYVVTAQTRTTREVEGVRHNGWDLVTVSGGSGTGFVYRVADTIFHWKDVQSTTLLPYKVLVGPVIAGTFWKGRDLYRFEYLIVRIEDFYSPTANHTFKGCAKVKRTSLDGEVKYYWWAPAWGRVREADFEGEQCLGGEDLKRLEKNPEYP
ncbi:MAG: hypothetical protein WBC42_07115 [Candidatus Zixiibacteriota bacterium]